jgi:hypothetical protein
MLQNNERWNLKFLSILLHKKIIMKRIKNIPKNKVMDISNLTTIVTKYQTWKRRTPTQNNNSWFFLGNHESTINLNLTLGSQQLFWGQVRLVAHQQLVHIVTIILVNFIQLLLHIVQTLLVCDIIDHLPKCNNIQWWAHIIGLNDVNI